MTRHNCHNRPRRGKSNCGGAYLQQCVVRQEIQDDASAIIATTFAFLDVKRRASFCSRGVTGRAKAARHVHFNRESTSHTSGPLPVDAPSHRQHLQPSLHGEILVTALPSTAAGLPKPQRQCHVLRTEVEVWQEDPWHQLTTEIEGQQLLWQYTFFWLWGMHTMHVACATAPEIAAADALGPALRWMKM